LPISKDNQKNIKKGVDRTRLFNYTTDMTDDLNNITMQLLKAHPHDSGMVKAREMIEEMIKDRDQKLSAQINREREESVEAHNQGV
jgi:gamma-glutamylcysteine synthetase